jgi:hypothetical protein
MIIARSLERILHEMEDTSRVAYYLLNPYTRITTFGDHLAFRQGQLTYMPAGRKQVVLDDGSWANEGRQAGRPARIARRFLRPDIVEQWLSDKDFETFAHKLSAKDASRLGAFQLVKGQDIAKWYDERTYAPENTPLTHSCMRYPSCQKFFSLYTENAPMVQMLIFTDNHDLLLGRALVWTTDQGTLLDRVYGSELMVELFREYAAQQGWMYRFYNSYDYETQFVENGKVVNKRLTIPLTRHDFSWYPYVDTFKYYNRREGTLTNDYDATYHVTLTGTQGNDHRGLSPNN